MKSRNRKNRQRFALARRNPLVGFKQHKRVRRGFTIERLEDRLVFSVEPTGVQLPQAVSYSTSTLAGALTTAYRESQWTELQAAYSNSTSYTTETLALPSDPMFENQWHLLNTAQDTAIPSLQHLFGVAGQDINVVPVWNAGITGNGVLVAVIDSGVQTSHPDLQDNLNSTLQYNALTNTTTNVGPDGGDPDGYHGTAVAGIIGATANNGIGGTGVAPGATLVPIKLIASGGTAESDFNAFAWAMNNGVDITNNSWRFVGNGGANREATPIDPSLYGILRQSALNGRDGLGMINVFASGNDAGPFFTSTFPGNIGNYDSSSYSAIANSRYVITVSGFDHDGLYLNADGTFTTYPMAGPNVLVAAPTGSNGVTSIAQDDGYGSGIWTTDLTGDDGANAAPLPSGFDPDVDPWPDPDYTSRFNGTSASAPMVSGVIALMLEANPNLTYRDVQEILVRSARQVAQFESPSSGVQSGTLTSQNTWIVNQIPPYRETDDYFNPLFIGPGIGRQDPIADPATDGIAGFGFDEYAPDTNDAARQLFSQYEPQPSLFTNGSGYTVSQGYGIYGDSIGYGHGAIDADLAVKMAKQWSSLNQNIAQGTERTFTTGIINQGPNTGLAIPAAEKSNDDSGNFIVPGGIGSFGDFIAYYEEFYSDTPFVDYDGPLAGARGLSYLDFAVPPAQGIDVEWVEVRMELDGPAADLDYLRIFLVSPDGTQSELNSYFGDPEIFSGTFSWQFLATPPGFIDPVGNINNNGDSFLWTWSTNRSWGESTNSSVLLHAATGEPVLDGAGNPIFRNWELHIENYSTSDFILPIVEVVWHGKPISGGTFDPNYGSEGIASAQRVQGFVGIDTNGDEDFNYSRYIQTLSGQHTDVSTIRANDIHRQLDFDDANHNGILDYGLDANGKFGPLETITQEPFAENIIVQARRVFNGVAEVTPIAQFLTGADGNYYFDLNVAGDQAYAASIGATLEYEIGVLDQEGRALLEDVDTPAMSTSNSAYTYLAHYKQTWRITPDWFFAPDHDNPVNLGNNPGEIFYDPITKSPVAWTNNGALERVPMAVKNVNFLLKEDAPPDEFNVNGTVYADLNANGVFDGNDSPAANVYVYLDGNRNGVPEVAEPRYQTDAYGHYSFTIQTDHADTFAIGVIRPTNEWLFTDAGHDGIQEVYAGPGSPDQVVNLFLFPPNNPNPGGGSGPANIRGVVFNDADASGSRGLVEVGIAEMRVFIDANQNGIWDSATEESQVTATNGSFAFSITTPGTFRINIDIADKGTPAAFWNVTTPSLGYFDVTIGAGGNVSGLEFGLNSRVDSDWGDLPDSYGTTAATNGPRHLITFGFQLGASIDGEVDGIPSLDASGESLAGKGYDDGVVIVSNGGLLVKGDNTLRVTVSGVGGLLTGWMDFNGDGHFDESERLTWRLNGSTLGGEADINPGTWDLTVSVPNSVVGNKMASRFRWGEQGLSFLGPAAVGEVEDYMFPLVSLLGDYNQDGTVNQADYNVWRKSNGQNVTPFSGADGNGDGVVGQADYDIWLAHFGDTASSGSGNSVAAGSSADFGSLVGAAALVADSSSFGAVVGSSTFSYSRTYGPSARSSAGLTSSAVISPAVAAVVDANNLTAANLAFDAFVLDGGASSSSLSASSGTPVSSNSVSQSTADANLLLVDLAIGEMDESSWKSADVSMPEGSHNDIEDVSDLALAAVMSDDNNWWDGV